MQQETTDDLVARFRSALEQKDVAAREWERQAGQLSASLNATRTKFDAANAEAGLLYKTLQELRRNVHFAYVTVDYEGKWGALCEDTMVIIDQVTPNGTAGAKEARRLWDETRCRVCGWPLAESVDKGCVPGNCSQRPLPKERADQGYALDVAEEAGDDT